MAGSASDRYGQADVKNPVVMMLRSANAVEGESPRESGKRAEHQPGERQHSDRNSSAHVTPLAPGRVYLSNMALELKLR